MSNEYFSPSTTAKYVLARASVPNSIETKVEAAFDKFPTEAEIKQNRVTYQGTETGAADTYVVTSTYPITAYAAGLRVGAIIGAGNTNTGPCTLNVDGVGAVAIKLFNGSDPAAGDMTAGRYCEWVYDGTNFILQSHYAGVLTVTGVTAATYGSATQVMQVTLDSYGRATAASNVTITPAWSSITSTPTTLAGYGITDAISNLVEDTTPQLGGNLDLNGNVITGLEIGTDVQAYDADTLKADTADVLTKGFATTPYNAGTKSSGTYTPDEANGNFQYAVNGGAHTLAPPTNNCNIVVQYTNNASAGAITTSGFTKVTGAFTTTNGDDFFAYITKNNGFSLLQIVALQ